MGPSNRIRNIRVIHLKWMFMSVCLLLIHVQPVWMRAQTEHAEDDFDLDDLDDDPEIDLDDDKLDGIGVLKEEDEEDQLTGMTNAGGGGRQEINHDPNYMDKGHKPGGLPMMSDSLFSLIILVYVSVAFCIVFFLFCWKANTSDNGVNGISDYKQECPLMTNELREAVSASEIKKSVNNDSKVLLAPPIPLQMVHLNNTGVTLGALPVVSEEKETSSAC